MSENSNLDYIKDKIEKLSRQIKYYDYMYFVRNISVIPDNVYDGLRNELYDLETKYPTLTPEDSPSQYVGFFFDYEDKIKHKIKMLSLKKAKDLNELKKFFNKYKHLEIVGELKIDGISVILEYKNSFLVSAATRGDGICGENITNHVTYIKSIPLKIEYTNPLIVIGEIFIPKDSLDKLAGEIKNSRNIAAGILGKKNYKQSEILDFFGYSMYSDSEEIKHLSQIEVIEKLRTFGFRTEEMTTKIGSEKDLEDFTQQADQCKTKINWLTDGIVLKINQRTEYEKLGQSMRYPLWAIAYKFVAPVETTTVEKIEWQIGRSGVYTPILIFNPVVISNTTISKVCLHNFKKFQELGLGAGALVIIEKSGDVTPHLQKVFDKGNFTEAPTTCFCCKTPLEIKLPNLFCPNKFCTERVIKKLLFFAQQLKINVLGEALISYLVLNQGFFFCAQIINLINVKECPNKTFGQKNWEKIRKSIKNSIKNHETVLCALPFFNINRNIIGSVSNLIITAWKENVNIKSFIDNNYNSTEITKKNILMNIDDLEHDLNEMKKILGYEK